MVSGNLRSRKTRSEARGVRRLPSLAALVEHALFAATLAGMACLCLVPLLTQAV